MPKPSAIKGTGKSEIIHGTAGNDTILAGGGNDTIYGEAGDDRLEGGRGDDIFIGGAGNDTMLGELGRDKVDYSQESGTQGIVVNLHGSESREYAPGQFIGPDTAFDTFGYTDTIDNIQDVIGTQYNDIIYGGTHDNNLVGGAGDDELYGDAGSDILDGGTGSDRLGGGPGADIIIGGEDIGGLDVDRLGYQAASSGIEVTFTGSEAGTVIDGGGATDTFSEVELVFGSTFDDVFFGSEGSSNTFIGLQGNDQFFGNGGDEGAPDTVDYSRDEAFGATHGVIVNQSGTNSVTLEGGFELAPDTAIDSFGDFDYLPGVRNVTGTNFADIFYGGSHANEIRGRGGDDQIYGFDGADRLFGGDGNDLLDGGNQGDRLDGNAGTDTLTGGGGNDRFVIDSAQEAAANTTPDVITDFAPGDKIVVLASDYGFTANSTLTTDQFTVGTDASTGQAQFFYNENTDVLYWDEDGVAGGSIAIASFSNNPTLSASDFLIL